MIEADPSLTTLLDLKFKQQFKAEHGTAGANKGKHGRNGKDTVVRVPVGSMVYFEGLAGPSGSAPPWREPGDLEAGSSEMENIYIVDDEDDDRSFQFQMAILEEDLAE